MAKWTIAEGDNYRVELESGLAHCCVWSRPDLDSAAGARLAAEKVAICHSLAFGEARGMLFDLREAPKVTGPKTQKSLEEILAVWESAARPIAVLVSPASLQKLQLSRLAREAAPQHAEVFVDLELARQWLAERMSIRHAPPVRTPPSSAPHPSSSLRAGAIKRRP